MSAFFHESFSESIEGDSTEFWEILVYEPSLFEWGWYACFTCDRYRHVSLIGVVIVIGTHVHSNID